jgi:hypothetical protein
LFPDDTLFPSQWNLHNTGQVGGVVDADIDAPEAWDLTLGSASVVVAIVDDGMDLDHADLRGNVFVNVGEIAGNGVDDDGNGYIDDVNGWDFLYHDNDPRNEGPDDYHATPCAGLVAAMTQNASGVAGVAPRCKILPCRFLGGANPTQLQIATAIDYAGEMADVVSMSWTYNLISSVVQDSLQRAAVDGRGGKGCLLVASTGNDAPLYPVGFPASSPQVMAIGASTIADVRASYSQYSSGFGVFLLAPSSQAGGLHAVPTLQTGGGYEDFTGTSAACPQVAGVCALILSVAPNLTRTEIEGILRDTADKIDAATAGYDSSGYSNTHGYGRVNARNAVFQGLPDLTPLAFDFQPRQADGTTTMSFAGNVRNVGRGTNDPCWLELWLSTNLRFETRDHQLGDAVLVPSLLPGDELDLGALSVVLSPPVPDGLYVVGVVVDRLGQQVEVDESNNTRFQSDYVLQVGAGTSDVDLLVEGFDFAGDVVIPGDVLQFYGNVANRGAQLGRDVWVEFRVSKDPGGGAPEYTLCQSVKTPVLEPGATFDLAPLRQTAYNLQQGLPNGRYRVGVIVDPIGEQIETDEDNNSVFRLDKWLIVRDPTGVRTWRQYR